MIINKVIKEQILLMDGAMGTYFADITGGQFTLCEPANLSSPDIILRIHKEYIDAGAQLIRSNTFAANPYSMDCDFDQVSAVIKAGIDIANKAVEGRKCGVAYSIGPIPEPFDVEDGKIEETYKKIIDVGLLKGVSIILLETFSRLDHVDMLVTYIKKQAADVQIMTNFTVNQQGYTKAGVNKSKLIEHTVKQNQVATYGFNCGIGASHLLKIIQETDFDPMKMVAVPNAGYPDQQLDRTVYQSNADFFAEMMIKICEEGVRIIGGCCGTRPEHIRKIRERLDLLDFSVIKEIVREKKEKASYQVIENTFRDKMMNNEFVIAVELDPPFKPEMNHLISGAHILKEVGVDLITFADSPLGKARADAMLMAAKVKRSVGIDVMPHVSLRDKNLIALRSGLIGAHLSDIRNVLIVTGDSIPSEDRDEVKSVFNMNAIKFMSYVSEMNEELHDDSFFIGGALNPYTKNLDAVIERVKKKQKAGAKFLLTQPIYNQEGIEAIRAIKKVVDIKILGGIMPLVSLRNARFLHYEFPGITIPDNVMASFCEDMTREAAESVGIELAIALARQMKASVDGFYFMTPFNRATMIEKIIKRLAL